MIYESVRERRKKFIYVSLFNWPHGLLWMEGKKEIFCSKIVFGSNGFVEKCFFLQPMTWPFLNGGKDIFLDFLS